MLGARDVRLLWGMDQYSSLYPRGSRCHIIMELGLKDHVYSGFGDLIGLIP